MNCGNIQLPEWLRLLTFDHEVLGLNPIGCEIQLMGVCVSLHKTFDCHTSSVLIIHHSSDLHEVSSITSHKALFSTRSFWARSDEVMVS